MIKHPANQKPQSAKHPMEDEVELFEEAEITPGELDDEDLIEELEDEALEEEELLADEEFGTEEDDDEGLVLDEGDEDAEVEAPAPAARRPEEGEEDEEAADLDEADVEPTLDEILRERVGVDEDELAVEEEEEEGRPEPVRGEDAENLVLPPQTWEFVCSSCFLVKNRTQLVDKERLLCRDCAE